MLMPDLVNNPGGDYSALIDSQGQKPSVFLDSHFSEGWSPFLVFAQLSLESEPGFSVRIVKVPSLKH